MQLFLLRHANADTPAPDDDHRWLTEKGIKQAGKVARFFESRELPLPRILTSPILRALETARIVADHLKTGVETVPWLACGMEPAEVLVQLRELDGEEPVMLVGHQPDLGMLAAHLLGIESPDALTIRKASLTLLEVASLRPGRARLDFSLPVRFM